MNLFEAALPPHERELLDFVGCPVVAHNARKYGFTSMKHLIDEAQVREVQIDLDLNDPLNPLKSGRLVPPSTLGAMDVAIPHPSGACPAEVLLIGGTPSGNESGANLPLHEDHMEILADALDRRGVKWQQWVYTNAFPARLPSALRGSGGLRENWKMEGCEFLRETIARVNPRVLVALGKDAYLTVLRLYGKKAQAEPTFTDARGTPVELPDGRTLLVSFPISTVVSYPEHRPEFEQDMGKLCSLVDRQYSQGSGLDDVKIKEIRTIYELDQYVQSFEKLVRSNYCLAVDLEWGEDHKLRTIQIAVSPTKCLVLVLHDANLNPLELQQEWELTRGLLRRLFMPSGKRICHLLGHNFRGDCQVLRAKGLDLMNYWVDHGFDTMQAYHIVPGHETLPKQLEVCASSFLGTPRYDLPLRAWLKKQKWKKIDKDKNGYGPVPDQILIPYGANDAIVTFRLCFAIGRSLKKFPRIQRLYRDILHPANEAWDEIETRGVRVDVPTLLALTDLYIEKGDEILADIRKSLEWPEFNPDSIDMRRDLLFGRGKRMKRGGFLQVRPPHVKSLGLAPFKASGKDKTPWEEVVEKGFELDKDPSTDGSTLRYLAAEHPMVKRLLDYALIKTVTKNVLRPYGYYDDAGESIDMDIADNEDLADALDEERRHTLVGYEEQKQSAFDYSESLMPDEPEKEDPRLTTDNGKGFLGFIGPDGAIHPNVRQTLKTGRCALLRPNLQAVSGKREEDVKPLFMVNGKLDPRYKPIRSCFIPVDGYVQVSADWAGAELAVNAAITGDPELQRVVNDSDLHAEFALKAFSNKVIVPPYEHEGKTYRKVSELSVAALKHAIDAKRADLKVLRSLAKAVVFGLMYGIGGKALSQQLKVEGNLVTPEEADSWIDMFFITYPKVWEHLEYVRACVHGDGYVETPFGRQRRFFKTPDRGRMKKHEREAGNLKLQATVADFMQLAMTNMCRMRRHGMPGAPAEFNEAMKHMKFTLQVHDDLLTEWPGWALKWAPMAYRIAMYEACSVLVNGKALRLKYGELDFHQAWGIKATTDFLRAAGVSEDFIAEICVMKDGKHVKTSFKESHN